MATHSSILAWETPWTEEPGGLQSTGRQSHLVTDAATRWEYIACFYTSVTCVTVNWKG